MRARPPFRGWLGWGLASGLAVVGAGAAGAGLPFETVAQGAHSRLTDALDVVVRTADEWTALWARHAGPGPPPAVDFARQLVVAVFAGRRPTSGYRIEITGVQVVDQEIRVVSQERAPLAGALSLPVVTTPFHVIRIPRSELTVRVLHSPA